MDTHAPVDVTCHRGWRILHQRLAGPEPWHPPLLLLGGAFQSLRSLRPVARAMDHPGDVWIVDLPGSGDTDPLPPSYGKGFLADCAAAVLREQQLGPVHVIGISLGSAIAYTLAQRHPDLVSRLVLVGAMSHVDARMESGLRRCLDVLERGDTEAFAEATCRVLMNRARRSDIERFDRTERLLRMTLGRMGRRDEEHFRANATRLLRHRSLDRARPVEAPTLVVTGEHDALTTPRAGRRLARRLPDGRFVTVPRADHLLPLERLDAATSVVRDFLHAEPEPIACGADPRGNAEPAAAGV